MQGALLVLVPAFVGLAVGLALMASVRRAADAEPMLRMVPLMALSGPLLALPLLMTLWLVQDAAAPAWALGVAGMAFGLQPALQGLIARRLLKPPRPPPARWSPLLRFMGVVALPDLLSVAALLVTVALYVPQAA